DPHQRQCLAIQPQRFVRTGLGIAAQREAGDDLGRGRVQIERQINGADQERRRQIGAEQDGLGGHDASLTIKEPSSCTSAVWPGNNKVVASSWVKTAGPDTKSPTPNRARS